MNLPAGGLAIQPVPLFVKHEQRVELVGADFVEAGFDAKLQCGTKIQGAPEQQGRLGVLGSIERVERAMGAAATVVGRVRAEARLAQLLAPQ